MSEERSAGAGRASTAARHHEVVIVGTGFSGLGMAARLRREGMHDFVVLERNDGIGGTWWDNTYPGCQCDVPSHLYSFSFAPNPDWSRTYGLQPEIRDYLGHTAERFGVTPHVRFRCALEHAQWDEEEGIWRLRASDGEMTARFLIAGVGPLSEPAVPDLPGLERFQGNVFHSARWDHDHELGGERVGVIGTGASAIQFVPRIQPKVRSLQVFQRTPPWILPHTDRPITRIERFLYRRFPGLQRAARLGIYLSREWLVVAFAKRRALMKLPEGLARRHLARQVKDPELRRKLTPSYTIGCKRILLSNDWYPALTAPNTEVVSDGIREVREHSVVTAAGEEIELDTIVLGTGFKVTDYPAADHLVGRGGRTLNDAWHGSPQAYLGTSIAGFPNLFMLLGPNTGLGHSSMVFMIEAQVAHVIRCMRALADTDAQAVEVREEAQAAYNDSVQRDLQGTVWNAGGCKSWYFDKTGRNTTLWPRFTWQFRRSARRLEPAAYRFLSRPGTLGLDAGDEGAELRGRPVAA
jgi:cation diffusion facilitator CzcD-associated flavoprotein CzcO